MQLSEEKLEAMLKTCVPGGSLCDPQAIADDIREWFSAALRAQADARPFWHAVVSKSAPVIDKAIRRLDVAEEYADKCRENYPDVTVVPLYTHPSLPAAQGLSDDEITQVWLDHGGSLNGNNFRSFARAILSRAATVAEPSEEAASYKRMFEDAVRSLAAIDEALGIDPDEAGGAEPILQAIEELKAAQQHAEPSHADSFASKAVYATAIADAQQAEPESVIKRQAQKIGELIADRDSWIEAHARLYRLYHDQSPKAGEEIHVNVEGGDVYTLPLQRSGMDKPRFVVHVPRPQQAEPGADERVKRDAERFANAFADGWVPLLPEDTNRTAELLRILAAQSGQRAGVPIEAVAKAYGYLWHVNEMNADFARIYPPAKAAYAARKVLREFLTHEQRGEAINEAGREIGRYVDEPDRAAPTQQQEGGS